jgi:hypothetical protein
LIGRDKVYKQVKIKLTNFVPFEMALSYGMKACSGLNLNTKANKVSVVFTKTQANDVTSRPNVIALLANVYARTIRC